ncbi:MAG: hypothetical protein LLF76_04255 [Planctomycetaceae bacterium]|nr:hypothetical protein [Planctomycetaceae bacterium]
MFSAVLGLVFGIVGIILDRPRWKAVLVTLIALLLLSPWLLSLASACF